MRLFLLLFLFQRLIFQLGDAMEKRAQSSMDTLLVMGFVIAVAMLVLLPYVQNQAITNSAVTAKLLILPYLERNPFPLKISLIEPRVTAGTLTIEVTTRGEMTNELRTSILGVSDLCADMCTQIRQNGPFSSATFTWTHIHPSAASISFCSAVTCN